jgi:hypothetical protein
MATSGSYSFTITAADIINEATMNCLKLGENETLTAKEYVDCLRKLNMMVKQWAGKMDFAPGLKIFTRKRAELFLSSTTGTYLLGPSGDHWTSLSFGARTTVAALAGATTLNVPTTTIFANDYIGIRLNTGALFWTRVTSITNATSLVLTVALPSAVAAGNWVHAYTAKAQRPLLIETINLRSYNYNDTPIDLIRTVQEYEGMSHNRTQSLPSAAYYEAQIGNGVLRLDCGGVQDTTYRLAITYMQQIEDFVNPTDNPSFPQEWYLPLCWGLSQQIAPMFDLEFTPTMQMNLTNSLAMAKQANAEVSDMYFQSGEW